MEMDIDSKKTKRLTQRYSTQSNLAEQHSDNIANINVSE